jgi:hypothetical protein
MRAAEGSPIRIDESVGSALCFAFVIVIIVVILRWTPSCLDISLPFERKRRSRRLRARNERAAFGGGRPRLEYGQLGGRGGWKPFGGVAKS